MSTAVSQTEHRGRMHEHLSRRVEVPVGVVEDRCVQQLTPVVLKEVVVELLPFRRPLAAANAAMLADGAGS